MQYHKTVTCNISVCTSYECTMEADKDVLHVPVEMGKKVIKNITWQCNLACRCGSTVYNCNIM